MPAPLDLRPGSTVLVSRYGRHYCAEVLCVVLSKQKKRVAYLEYGRLSSRPPFKPRWVILRASPIGLKLPARMPAISGLITADPSLRAQGVRCSQNHEALPIVALEDIVSAGWAWRYPDVTPREALEHALLLRPGSPATGWKELDPCTHTKTILGQPVKLKLDPTYATLTLLGPREITKKATFAKQGGRFITATAWAHKRVAEWLSRQNQRKVNP